MGEISAPGPHGDIWQRRRGMGVTHLVTGGEPLGVALRGGTTGCQQQEEGDYDEGRESQVPSSQRILRNPCVQRMRAATPSCSGRQSYPR